MAAAAARWVTALVGAGLVLIAVWGLVFAYQMLTLEGDEGGATVYGLFVLPSAIVVGLVGVGLFALAIRP